MTDLSAPPSPSSSPDAPTPRARRLTRRRVLLGGLGVLAVGAAGVGAYARELDRTLTDNLDRSLVLPEASPSAGGAATTAARETGTLNYLLLGSDSRNPDDEGEGRSDSIMLVHLNADRDHAWIVSFPRDMYVEIPGHGHAKINAAYAEGGAALTASTIESLTGVLVDHVVLVDFAGFIELTQDLGGVTVTNEHAFSSHGYDYPKGKITIAGTKALWFVRERHALPEGDLDRAANQRKVIKAVVAKGLSADVVANPVQFTSFVGNLAKHLTVDSGLTDDEIRATALSLRLSGSDVTLLQAPVSGFGTSPSGESIDVVDTAQLAELATALQEDRMAAYLKKYPEE